MATIEKRKSGDGFVYRAKVRVKGTEPRTATFPNKTLAKAWAQKIEVEIKEGQYMPSMQSQKRTLGEIISIYKERPKPLSITTSGCMERTNRCMQFEYDNARPHL